MSTLDKNLLLEMFRKMEEIRRMDLKIAQLVKKGKVPGMTHFSVGEEAANVGAMLALNENDLITSNHRGHGQAIAKGIDLNGMMAEILGKYTGTCKGKGGSMHIADLDAGNLGANGIEDVAAVEDVLRGVKYEREDVLKALQTLNLGRYFAGITAEEITEAVVE
ncbi:thiamine pyrophosphate-dependent enzyme [Streptococcus pneumoniae]